MVQACEEVNCRFRTHQIGAYAHVAKNDLTTASANQFRFLSFLPRYSWQTQCIRQASSSPDIEPLIHARCPGLLIDFVSMIPYKGSSPRNRRTQLHVCRHLTEIQHVPIFNDICRDRVYSRCTCGQTYVGFSDFRTTTLLNQTDLGSLGACSEDRAGILAASFNGQRSSAGEHRWWPDRCPQSLERGLL